MSLEGKIRLVLLTGFLGSGKTTLLKNLLENAQGRKIGVLINEFGKVGIDGTLIQKEGLEKMEISNGSIFCSCLEGSFTEGLIAFSGLPIDYLLVEGSGLADPSSLARILKDIEGKTHRAFDYRGMICVADAVRVDKLLEVVRAVESQLEHSQVILLNKVDQVDKDRIEEVERKIREINPRAVIIKTTFCKTEGDLLDSKGLNPEADKGEESSNTPASRPATLVLRAAGVYPQAEIREFLNEFAEQTFRIKGYVYTENGWFYVDGVGRDIVWKPAASSNPESELVVIFKKQKAALKIGKSRINTEEILKQKIASLWRERFTLPLVIE